MAKKISLVLEGGGMRGAYTAGCLSWLIDEGIEFKYAYGISTGAVHLCSYLIKEKDYLFDLSTKYICDPRLVGWRSLMREGNYVGYDLLFNHIFPDVFHYDMEKVLKVNSESKVGIYDLELGKTVYYKVKDLDKEMLLLKGACTLPILGKIVEYDGKKLLDGGITKMIPIEESVEDGIDLHMVITTKPADYIRKPAAKPIQALMRQVYRKYPSIGEDYAVRHLNYEKQINLVKSLQEEGKALLLCPSQSIPVKRLTGDPENLLKLYELGRKDMEERKEMIYELLAKAND